MVVGVLAHFHNDVKRYRGLIKLEEAAIYLTQCFVVYMENVVVLRTAKHFSPYLFDGLLFSCTLKIQLYSELLNIFPIRVCSFFIFV